MSQIETRNHKIKCHYGINDYAKYYKQNENEVDTNTFKSVLKDFLNAIRIEISTKSYTFRLPQRMGRVEIRKSKKEIKVDENGKIINKLVINWKATNKLWAENEEAKRKKIKIRYTNEHTNGYVFRPVYIKNTANFKNKSLYKMSVNREMRRATAPAIINKKMDAFLLNPVRNV